MTLRNDIRALRQQVTDLDRAVQALIDAHNQSEADPQIIVTEESTLRRDGKMGQTRRYQLRMRDSIPRNGCILSEEGAERKEPDVRDLLNDNIDSLVKLIAVEILGRELSLTVRERHGDRGGHEDVVTIDVGTTRNAQDEAGALRERLQRYFFNHGKRVRLVDVDTRFSDTKRVHGSSPSVVGGGAGTPVPGETTVGESATAGAGSSPSHPRGGGCQPDAPLTGASGQAARPCTMRRLYGHCPIHGDRR